MTFKFKKINKSYKNITFKIRKGTVDSNVIKEVCHRDVYRILNLKEKNETLKKVLDVGAHIGVFTVWVKENFPEAEVFSVEMDRDNYSLLVDNTKDLSNVKLYNAALIGFRGKPRGRSYFTKKGTWGHFLAFEGASGEGGVISEDKIQQDNSLFYREICSFFDEECNSQVDLLKIDAEGIEYDLILSLRDQLSNVSHLCMEVHSWAIPKKGWIDMENILFSNFREITILGKNPSNPKNQFFVYAR